MSADFAQFVQDVIRQLEQNTARVQAAAASLCYAIDRWQPTSATSEMRYGLAMEPLLLPKRKRRGQWYLENGEILDFTDTHIVREQKTTYLRSQYTMADLNMLCLARDAQTRKFTYDDAERWLISRRNGRIIPSKRIDAAPDPIDTTWRSRPEQHLSARELVMQSGLKGRALARELARIR